MKPEWILTVCGAAGAVGAASGRPILAWWAHLIWCGVNVGWMVHDWSIGQHAQAAQFGVYLLVAVWGVWRWRPGGGRSR